MNQADSELTEALTVRYPDLTPEQRARLSTGITQEIAGALRRGESIGLVRPLPGGSLHIDRLTIENKEQ